MKVEPKKNIIKPNITVNRPGSNRFLHKGISRTNTKRFEPPRFTPNNDPLIKSNTIDNPVKGFSSITACTKPGESFNATKTNQDSYLIDTEVAKDSNKILFGVFDGHGSHGDKVSQYLTANFTSKLFLGR